MQELSDKVARRKKAIRNKAEGFLALALLFLFCTDSFSQLRTCDLPYTCYATGWKCEHKEYKFTPVTYVAWLNENDRSLCDEPYYSTATIVKVVCRENCQPMGKWYKDESGECQP